MNGLDQILNVQAGLTKAAPQLKQLQESCTALEASFMKTLVGEMRKSAGNVHFGQQLGGDVYQDMMDDNLSTLLAQKEGTQLSDVMAAPMAKQVLAQALGQVRSAQTGDKN